MSPWNRSTSDRSSTEDAVHEPRDGGESRKRSKRRSSWGDSFKRKLHKWSAPGPDRSNDDLSDASSIDSMRTTLQRSRSSSGSHTRRPSDTREPIRRRSMSDWRSTDRHSDQYDPTQASSQKPKIMFMQYKPTPLEEEISDMAEQISWEANAEKPPGTGRVDVIVVVPTSGRQSGRDSQVYKEEYAQRQNVGETRGSAVTRSEWERSGLDWRDAGDNDMTNHYDEGDAWPPRSAPTSHRLSSTSTTSRYPISESISSPPSIGPPVAPPYPSSTPTAQAPTPLPEPANPAAGNASTFSAAEVEALVKFFLDQQSSAGSHNASQTASSAMPTMTPASTSSLVAAH